MPITNGQQTIGTAAQAIDGVSVHQSTLFIHNNDTTKNLYIGGSAVNATEGIPLAKLQYIELPVPPLETYYLIAESGTVSVSWMRIDQD